MSLNSTQLSNIDRIIGAKSLCSAVVRLYRTTGDDWEYTGIVGAAAISRKNGFATISFVDLESQSELFAEELYYNFNYQTPKPFFHYFEVQDCVAGFSFADDGEAGNFSLQVNNNKPSKSQPPPINTPPPTTTVQQPSRPPPPKQTPTPTPTTNTISAPSSQDKGKKKEKGGGFFSKLFGGAKKEEEVHEISGPTNFRHESHIGWDPVNGFDIRNIPPAWKELFKKAGVKKSDLQDKDTAKLVMETIVENIGGPPQNTPPPPSYPNQSTPPPPPPRGGNNTGGESFQTPPPPPTMDMGSNAPPPPTPPPPMPMDSGNAPPPPMPPPSFSDDKPSAPPRGGGGNAPLSFAEQLKNKQTSGLKTVDRPVENLPQLPEDTGGLANALASALKNRRGAIEEDMKRFIL